MTLALIWLGLFVFLRLPPVEDAMAALAYANLNAYA